MAYFQRWVRASAVVCWEPRDPKRQPCDQPWSRCNSSSISPLRQPLSLHPVLSGGKKTSTTSSGNNDLNTEEEEPQLTYVDLDYVVLGFQEEDTHFVYGGDAFDHGADLVFSRALLDFKARYPDRVHLILGNRDLNKMVMRHIFGPFPSAFASKIVAPPSSSSAPQQKEKEKAAAAAVITPFQALTGGPRSSGRGVDGHLSPEAAEEALFPSASGPPPKVSYASFLASEAAGAAAGNTSPPVTADPVSFVRWALVHRLGSPKAFEHRRRELHAIKCRWAEIVKEVNRTQTVGSDDVDVDDDVLPRGNSTTTTDLPSDEEVAASFAVAAEPGGVYYEYLRLGQLLDRIDSVLFVHGGICEDNLGLVPSLEARYDRPLKNCQKLVDVVRENEPGEVEGEEEEADGRRQTPPRAPSASASAVPVPCPDSAYLPMASSPIEWFNALHRFKWEAMWEYTRWNGNRGNALRRYGNHCICTKYSVTVNSLIKKDGPSYFSLPVAEFLLSHGIETVCVGHMPTGDTPAIIRQPPAGVLTCIAADNSYSGRNNAWTTPFNPRGKALTEVLLHYLSATTPHRSPPPSQEEEDGGSLFIHIHGERADGTPFAFDVDSAEPYLGRCVERRRPLSGSEDDKKENSKEKGKEANGVVERWWVKRREIRKNTVEEEEEQAYYALHHTNNSFFAEQEEVLPQSALEKLFAQHPMAHSPVGGVLRNTHTKESLRNIPVHRIKTKVTPSL